MDGVDIGDRDLEVHAAPERAFQRRRPEAPAGTGGLLEHELDPVRDEVGEPRRWTLEGDTETEYGGVEGDRDRQVVDIELRHEPGPEIDTSHAPQ
jgi:hypothetical protein